MSLLLSHVNYFLAYSRKSAIRTSVIRTSVIKMGQLSGHQNFISSTGLTK